MTTLMQAASRRPSWKEVLDQHAPLLLPVAHDALTARLIQLAGYPAYQIGGFSLCGARLVPTDIDLSYLGGGTISVTKTNTFTPSHVLSASPACFASRV